MKKNINIIFLFLTMLISSCIYANEPSSNQIKSSTLSIIIHKPIDVVYAFTTDPHKTPEWIHSIAAEQTNEWPPRQGTIYRNRGQSGPWSIYKVTKYVKEKEFELTKQDKSTYRVNYTYTTCPDGSTKLVYHEWVTNGELDNPFTQDALKKLKIAIESH